MFELEIEKIRNRKRKAKPKTQLNPRPRPGPLSLFPVTTQHSPLQPSSFPRGPASFFPQPPRAHHLPSPLPGLPRLSTSRSSPATHPYPARYTRLPTGPASPASPVTPRRSPGPHASEPAPHPTDRLAPRVSTLFSPSFPAPRNGRARHAVFPGGISHARRARQGRRRPIRRVPGPPPNLIFHQRATRNPNHTATPSSTAKGPLRCRGSAAPPQHRPPGSHTCSVSPSRTAPCRRIEGSARAAPDFPSATRRR